MNILCPNPDCTSYEPTHSKIKAIVRNGSFFRKSDSRTISRFFCRNCKSYFSRSTFQLTYRQKKRRINHSLYQLLCSGVSQRRAARILKVNPKTIARHFRYLGEKARMDHIRWVHQYESEPLRQIQFDDLETAEHTKYKPLSISLAIEPKHRKIMSFQVSQMPAKGLIAKKAIQKYGHREDQRPEGWNHLLKTIKPFVAKYCTFTSDENPHYPRFIRKHHPTATHIQMKGGRGCVTGQGELKKLHFDPLFSLNHTCAMLRANLNRLFRRTWCMSKTRQGLIDHLSIYTVYHNQILTPSSAINGGS